MKLKITAIGNSAGVILPKELLAHLRLGKGDEAQVSFMRIYKVCLQRDIAFCS